MQFMNACILQYKKVDDKWRYDEEMTLRAFHKKENEWDVKLCSEMFFNSAYILVQNIDYEMQ